MKVKPTRFLSQLCLIVMLTLITGALKAQVTIVKEDFEDADFTGYSTAENKFFINGADYFERGTNGAPFAFSQNVTGFGGSNFIGLEDLDGALFTVDPHWLALDAQDISGYSNMSISIKFAAPNTIPMRYEIEDFFTVEYSIDGGAFQKVLDFKGGHNASGAPTGSGDRMRRDDDLDGTYSVEVSGGAMQTFTANLDNIKGSPVTGSSMIIRVRFSSEGSHEEMAFDDIELKGTYSASSVSASITSQTNVDCNGNATGSLTVTAIDGTPNFDYLWSNGSSTSNTSSTTNSISSLTAGTYTVTVTDDNGTTATASSTVTQPTVLSAGTGSAGNVTCNGGSDGWIAGYGTGGTYPHTYSWSNGATTAGNMSLSAGAYTLTVTDASGCTATTSLTITEPAALALSSATTATSIDLTVGGGASPYTYSWSNGATNQDISSLSSGTYTVTVTDNNGCTASLSATAMASELVCYNGLPDTLESSSAPSGGSGNFVYQWQTSVDGSTAWTVAPGKNDSSIYIPSVAVTDTIYFRRQVTDTTCSATAYSNVKAIFVLDSIGIAGTPVAATCGASDGALNITVSGGQAPYTYAWSNSATTQNISSVAAGTYTITVTDNLGCVNSKTFIVPGASSVVAGAVVDSNVTCNGLSDGGATASVSGGATPYTYLWSNAATTASITGVAAGTYTVTISDNNGCTSTASASITEPTTLVASSVVDSDVTCSGGNDGSATASASGGMTPYSYSWSNGETTASVNNLMEGTYTVTITDNNGCTAMASTTISVGGGSSSYTVSGPANGQGPLLNTESTSSSVGWTTLHAYNSGGSGSVNSWSAPLQIGFPFEFYDSPVTHLCVSKNYLLTFDTTVAGSILGSSISGSNSSMPTPDLPDNTIAYLWGSFAGSLGSNDDIWYKEFGTSPNRQLWIKNFSFAHESQAFTYNFVVLEENTNNIYVVDARNSTQGVGSYTIGIQKDGTEGMQHGSSPNISAISNNTTSPWPNVSYYTLAPASAGLKVTASVDSNATCNGQYDAGITAITSGSVSPYTYLWSNSATTASITGLSAGTYTVTVTSGNGCTATSSATVTEPAALVASTLVDSNVTCNGLSDGGATASVTGGTAPYTYMWSNSATTASITGVAAGTYTVTITDNKGCSDTSMVTVTEPATLVASTLVDSNVTCNGLSDGGATASATGGTAPYTYMWSNSATTASITGIAAGTYTVTITDNKGCSDTSMVTVTEPATLVASTLVDSNVTCNGLSDGGATASVTGGTAPYTYMWSNSATTASITGVAAGTYTVTITDNKGCSDTSMVTVTEPALLVASTLVDSNVTCNGLYDGGATASVTGGTAPYTYLWSNAATTASINGVSAGTYTVTITDNKGCSDTSMVTITEPATLVASTLVDSNVTCNGLYDGGATASVTGGTAPYTYMWSNAATTASINGVSAGTYTVTITDNKGCSDTSMVTVTEPATLVASTLVDSNVTCNGLYDGGATASVTGGTAPYTYMWSNAATTASINGVSAGTYTVTITDNKGCSDTSMVTVTEPATLVASAIVDSNETCTGASNGGLSSSASGGTSPYTYNWSNGASTASVQGITSGTYTVTVTDAKGCTASASQSVIMVDTIAPFIQLPISSTDTVDLYLPAAGGISIFSTTSSIVTSGLVKDSCGVDTAYYSPDTLSCGNVGYNAITLHARDINGNTSSLSFHTELKDTIKPTVVTQDITVYLDATGNTSILASYLDNGTSDACGIDSLHLSKYDFDCSNVGDVTVQLYATDVNGNTAMANATVTVIDSTKPVLATRNVTAYLDATGNTSINATFIDNGTADECGLDTLLLSKYDFDCSNVGANTITFTAKDVNNNSISTTATVTVVDTISPVAAAQNISVYLDATGNGTITAADVDNGSADACGLDTLLISQYNFDCSHVGANNVTLTATDVNSNSSSETIIVTVIDTIKPVVLTQNTTIYLNGAGQASIVDGDINNVSTDACGIASTSLSEYNFDCSNTGANTVYLSVTDVNGNVDSASATVTVLDTISPVAKVHSITAYLDASGTVVVSPADVDNGSSDNCGFTLSLSQTTFDCTETGLNLKTFTITDASGNKDSKDAWITIKDTISPELHLYQSLTVSLDQFGSATIAPTQMDSASTDNCSNLLFFTASKTTFNCSNLGPNTITVTAYDNKNNSTTGTAIVTVKDYQAPVVVTQNITAYLDGSGSVTVLPTDVNNGTTDNCTVDSLWLDKDNFSCSNLGQNIVKLYAKDQSGNSAQANAVITVLDTISPMVAAQNITIYLDVNGAASITTADINNGSADNCAIQSLSLSKTAFDCSNVGANTVTLTATDASANSKTATATVTVMDTISPVVAAQNITVSLDANGAASITAADIDNGSSDNCGIQSMSVDVTTFDCTDLGANTVTLTVLDNNGNSTTATATVTVEDNTDPTVITQDITVYLDANGAAAITTTDVDNGSADNCSIQSMSLDVTAFDCSDLGSNVVTLTATDGSANTSSATAIVTVMDTISPMVAAQNITIYLDVNGAASITTADINNGSADNCAIQSLSLSNTAFDCSNVGANTVTLTASDASANSKTATATVTVMDTISPMVATQNITVSLDANGAASITAADIDNGSSDNCGIQSMSVDVTTFDCTDLGANSVTLTVLDNNGNSTTATATVTVVDNTAPIVATQNITIYLDANGDASIVPADVDNNSSDNCGITNYSLDISVFDCADLGQNLVMLTATDASNNSSTKSAFVTVLDTIDPTIDNLPATITAYAPANQCAANVQWPNITGSDNCGVSLVNVSKANGGLFSLGTTTVNVSVADASGNTVNQSFNVVVVDTVSPTVSNVPNNYTVVPNANSCDAIVNWIEPVAIDNCGGVTWTKSHIPGSVFQVGTTPVTYTATDSDNNSTTVSFVVVVTDQLAPTISNVPANITVSSDAGSCDAVVNFTAPAVNDNCTGATLNASHTSGSVFPIGTTTVVFTAVDGANNTTTASFTITVEDNQKPVVSSMPANDTVGACGSTYTYAMPVATDNCSAVSITQTSGLPSGSIFPAGVTVNTFRISDANGNDTVVSFAVVVVPQGMPNLPNVLEVCANMPAVELTLGQNIVWSGNGIVGGAQFNPAAAGAGRHQLSYTYTDNMGCTVSGSIYVTVLPVPVKPVISRIGSTTLSTDNYNSYQWYRNGVAIPGATGKTYSYTIGGNYQVMVANSSGCESYSDGMVIGTSGGGIGLEENQLSQLEMYPNPADDLLTFDLKGFDHREMEVVIFNTAGKKVFEVKDQTSAEGKLTIDLGHLPDATYIVRIQAGDESAVKRVVIY